MKVLFLDRDGIINIERGDYTWRREDFQFTEHLFEFLRKFKEADYQFIVITNQGGINKGLYTTEDVESVHSFMKAGFKKEGLTLLDVFYCPHHSNFQKCLCRKPGSLMLEKAMALFDVDKKYSLMLGDTDRDVEAAKAAGIKGFLIPKNPDWLDITLDWAL